MLLTVMLSWVYLTYDLLVGCPALRAVFLLFSKLHQSVRLKGLRPFGKGKNILKNNFLMLVMSAITAFLYSKLSSSCIPNREGKHYSNSRHVMYRLPDVIPSSSLGTQKRASSTKWESIPKTASISITQSITQRSQQTPGKMQGSAISTTQAFAYNSTYHSHVH